MSTLLEVSPSPMRIWKNGPAHWIVLGLCFAGSLTAFYPVLEFMVSTWGQVEEYSYGYFIPLVSAFLVWQRSDALRAQAREGSLGGLALIALALMLRWVGEASAIRMIGQYGFVVAVFGISVCSIGWRGTRLIAVPLAILLFMIPLPQFLLRELSLSLQMLSSQFGVALIRQFGISVFLEGNVIDLGSYKLQVAEACNGLRYLFPLMVLGLLAAYFYRGALWQRLLLLLSTIPLTIVINSLRIGLIGVTVEHWGREMAEGLLHDLEGWFMFLVCLGLLLGEMALLSRLDGARRLREVFAIELPEPVRKDAKAASQPLSLAVLACALLLATAGLLAIGHMPRSQLHPTRTPLAVFPLHLDDIWEGRPDRIEPDVLAVLAVDDYMIANYQRGEHEPWVNFYVAWYNEQSNGGSSHSPRTCIPGGGWSILQLDKTDVSAQAAALSVNRVVIQRGENKQLVYYWFRQRGRTLTSELAVKWYVLRDSIARGRSDGALVRLVTPIVPGEPDDAADARLRAFLGALQPRLTAYVPD